MDDRGPTTSVPQAIKIAIEHHQSGRLPEAEDIYRQILQVEPNHADALHLLGMIAHEAGKTELAVGLINKAIAANPSIPIYYNNLGRALHDAGRFDDAISSYRKALLLKQDFAEAHSNLGAVLRDQGQFDDAISSYHKALSLKPDLAVTHNNLGNALKEKGKIDEAIASYHRALSLKPDYYQAHSNLGNALKDQGKPGESVASYRKALSLRPDVAMAHSNYLLAAQYDPAYSLETYRADYLNFAARFEAPVRPNWPAHGDCQAPQRKLRVGFVSGDFHTHPVGFFLESVFAHLDRKLLDVFLYTTNAYADDLTLRLQSMEFAWESLVGESDDSATRRIRDDAIDILVDLSGHTAQNRLTLFARKPAPIQVTWIGSFATNGLQAIDYILCDVHVLPHDEVDHFSEKPWYLPDTRLCFTPPAYDIAVGALPAATSGRVTFCCFNNLGKMNDAVVVLWAQILHAVPGSRLFLKAKQLNDLSMHRYTSARFAAHGIAADRLMLEGSSSRADYLAAYNKVDIALDPFPFTGGTTTVEGLWMGVPVITKRGDRFIAHQGESILHNVGMSDWIAADNEAYVAIATARAADLSSLASRRANLRPQLLASPLCSAPAFARNLEAAFAGMWLAYCTQR